MASALRTAEAVAGKATGSASMRPNGAIVVLESHGSAWEAGLRVHDRVVSINRRSVTSASAVVRALQVLPVGRPLSIGVIRNGTRLTLHIRSNPGVGQLGVELVTGWAGTPATSISVPGVGGPSGGLLAALALTAVEGGGDLAGPNVVAGTGTLSSSGTVGPITGAPYKVVGAEQVGATVFFVPTIDAGSVEAEHPHLTVVPVHAYRDAVNWLCSHGGTSTACKS
jgi:PDZ domain-containing protein